MPESTPGKEIPAVTVRSLSCPNCGATVIVRSFGQAVTVVCGSCQSILDAQDPKVQILQRFQAAVKYEPLIPLGSRGKLRGTLYEVGVASVAPLKWKASPIAGANMSCSIRTRAFAISPNMTATGIMCLCCALFPMRVAARAAKHQ